jgi:hypothetical protein
LISVIGGLIQLFTIISSPTFSVSLFYPINSIVFNRLRLFFFTDRYQVEDIKYAINDIEYQTCVRFVERTFEKDYILVTVRKTIDILCVYAEY